MPRPYSSGEYQRNRRALLADHPACAVRGPGCTGVATTADHIVALTVGGDSSLTNLRPCCATCNNTLGGRLGRARQLAANGSAQRHPSAHTAHADGFLDAPVHAGSPACLQISPTIRPDRRRWEDLAPLIPKSGRDQPRLATPAAGDGTLGADVAKFAAEHSHEPMEWHRLVWERLLATVHGKLAHRQGLISTARQNGKSWCLEMLAAWWMLERASTHGPQHVAWVSHDLRLSEQSFLRLARLLGPWTSYRTNSFGRQRLELDTGRCSPCSRTRPAPATATRTTS